MLMVLAVYLLGLSLQVNLSLGRCLLVIPIAHLLSSLPVTINGMGLREASYVVLLAGWGVAEEQALSMSLAYSFSLLLLGVIGGVIWMLSHSTSKEKVVSNEGGVGHV